MKQVDIEEEVNLQEVKVSVKKEDIFDFVFGYVRERKSRRFRSQSGGERKQTL